MRINDPQATLRPFRSFRPVRLALLFSILITASCNEGTPEGQVIAVVNGDEITIAELNEEARARNIVGANEPSVRGALLRDLIDRKLLVQKAVKEGLDRNRQHLIAVERMKEVLLAQRLLASVGQGLNAPSQAELQRYIAADPAAFDRRTILSVDQITFPRPSDPELIRRLEAAETLAAIDALLLEAALPRERLVKTWDSAVLPEAVIARLLGLKPGKPFLLPHGNLLIAGEVLSSTAQPMENEQRLRLATERLLAERRNSLMQKTLESARTDARVRYQAGFDPPPEQPPKAVAPEQRR